SQLRLGSRACTRSIPGRSILGTPTRLAYPPAQLSSPLNPPRPPPLALWQPPHFDWITAAWIAAHDGGKVVVDVGDTVVAVAVVVVVDDVLVGVAARMQSVS